MLANIVQRNVSTLSHRRPPHLAVGLDALRVHGKGIGIVQRLGGAEGVDAALVAVADIVGSGNLGQVGGLVNQDVRLVGGAARGGGGGELEEVVADDNVAAAAGLGVGDDAVAAEVADVGAVEASAARRAAEEGGGLAKDAGDGGLCARRGRLEVLLQTGASVGGRLGVGHVRLGLGEGGGDGRLLGAGAVGLDGDALGVQGLVEGGVDRGGLGAVDGGLEDARVEDDLAGDLVAALLGVAEGSRAGDVEIATAAQVVDLGGVPLDLDDLAGLDGLEGRVGEIGIVNVDSHASEGNLADCL